MMTLLKPRELLLHLARAGAGAVMLLGLSVMVGWHLHLTALIRVNPQFVPMKYNTALGLFTAGAGLLAWQRRRQHLCLVLGYGLCLLGALSLWEIQGGVDLGIDELLMKAYIQGNGGHPGRMAPNTAVCFILMGCMLAAMGVQRARRSWRAVGLLAALLTGLGMAALSGYLFHIPAAYGWTHYTQMAVHTAAAFVVLGMSCLALSHAEQEQGARWGPAAIGILSSTTTLCLWQALRLAPNQVQATRAALMVLAAGMLLSLALVAATRAGMEAQEQSEGRAAGLRRQEFLNGELHRSEEELRRVLDSIRDYAITQLDPEGRMVRGNPGFAAMTGYQEGEAVGLPSERMYPPDQEAQQQAAEALREAAAQGRSEQEAWQVRKDGTRYEANIILTAIYDAPGRLCGYTRVARDITGPKQDERRMRELVRELQRSNEELANFAYVASHDLKSPLHAVEQLANWIGEDLGDNLPSQTREHMSLMRGRIARMEHLLNDLLDYSRAGRQNQATELVDTGPLTRSIFDYLDHPAAVTLRLESAMPVLRCAHVPLETTLRNLIGNAIKHGRRPDGTIRVGAFERETEVEFWISDDGPGIAHEHQERVFGMFQTLKPRDEVEGSGMGLAIVKKCVEAAGGWIRLESDGVHGSTFRFGWPRTKTLEPNYDERSKAVQGSHHPVCG